MQHDQNDYDYWSATSSTFDIDNDYVIGKTTNREIKTWLINQFSTNDIVLELACGTGFTSDWIAEGVKHLTATDMSQEMLELARIRFAQHGNVVVQTEDCYCTSFKEESFDIVLLANVIHVVRDPSAVLMEAHRILKTHGQIIVVDYTSHGLSPEDKKNMMRRYFSRWGPIPEQSFAATPDGLRKLAEESGFTVEESILVGDKSKAVCLLAKKN